MAQGNESACPYATLFIGVTMKLTGWVLALAAAGMVPAVAQAQTAAEPTTNVTADNANLAEPASGAPASATAATAMDNAPVMAPTPGIGVPDGRMGLQEQVTPIGKEAAAFHDDWLLLLCVVISVFVLALMLYALVKFRRGANPTPSRNSHNTTLEVLWTLIPVVILVTIAVPSIRLIRHQYTPPPADVTIKVTGHQWYWSYEYPDKGVSFDSYMLKEAGDPGLQPGQRARTDADGPPLLAVDKRVVVPVGKVVKFLVTADDVIHSFAIPAFWVKQDANPGQVHETWIKVDRPGVYFGQCSELCGARHGFMPIAVEAVPQAQFDAWVAANGTPPAAEAPAPAAATNATVTTAAAPAAAAPATAIPATAASGQ